MTAVWIVAACAVWAAWVIAGYPLALALRARWFPRPPREGTCEPSVTAIVPVYNGAAFLAAKLDSILGSDYPAARLDVLVLSDESTDETDSIGAAFARRHPERVRFARLPKGGKAAALNAALPQVRSELVLMTDVRQRLQPDCVRLLAGMFADPEVGVASGNLVILSGESSGEANVGLYWQYESWIRENLGLTDSLLGATGPIYAIRRELVRPLPAGCILDDVWLPMQAVLAGRRSVWNKRAVAWDYPTSLDAEFDRKVRTQAGLFQLLWQLPSLWTFRNRLLWPFLFLKMGRLLLPEVLLVCFMAGFWLADPWRIGVLGGQAVFYALAAIDAWVPERTALKRLTAPLRAFVTLLAAALCAVAIFFVRPERLWKRTRVRASEAPGASE